jgi:YbbR domain-containing protein
VKLRPRFPLLFLLSVLAAFMLWYVLSAQRTREISVRGVRAQLTLVNIPSNLVLVSGVPDTVSVQLRGPLSRALDPRAPLEVLLDLSNARPGTNSYPINASDIPLPPEVEVVSVEPAAISLELERRQTLSVALRPVVEGTPATGFVLASVRVMPEQVAIQGPESRLDGVDFVETTPISVEGATGPVEATVQPVLPDPLLRLLSAVPVQVLVQVEPRAAPTPAPR